MEYSFEKIEAIAAKLKAMPEIEKKQQKLNKKESIKMLAKDISNLKKRGYTLKQITELLRGEEFDISESTLKSYLQDKPNRKKMTSTTTPKINNQTIEPSVNLKGMEEI